MSLSERIAERRQTNLTPIVERRQDDRRSTPRWIRLLTERQLRGEDGFTVYDYTYDVRNEAA